jgi:hypothetical protein
MVEHKPEHSSPGLTPSTEKEKSLLVETKEQCIAVYGRDHEDPLFDILDPMLYSKTHDTL